MTGVPKEFTIIGTRSGDTKSSCKVCGFSYAEHNGNRCALCHEAVEHHTSESFAECKSGRLRMAMARSVAGVELDQYDRLCLEEHEA